MIVKGWQDSERDDMRAMGKPGTKEALNRGGKFARDWANWEGKGEKFRRAIHGNHERVPFSGLEKKGSPPGP